MARWYTVPMNGMNRRFFILTLAGAAFFAALIQVPQSLHQMHPLSQGVLVQLNSDEDAYFARVEEALVGRGDQSAEAIVGDPSPPGSQFALLERVIGTLFRPTGLRAAEVMRIMDSVTAFLLFPLLVAFLVLCGLSRRASYAGAVLFYSLMFHTLNRPIHPGTSFLLMMFVLNGIILGLQRSPWWGIAAGALLGLLLGVYFWSWTFAWLWYVLLLVWVFIEQRADARNSSARSIAWGFGKSEIRRLLLFGLVAAVAALPFVLGIFELTRHPLYEQASFRSGVRLMRTPESWPYSILFTLMAAGVLGALPTRFDALRRHRFGIITVLTAFAVIHQQVLHGRVLDFVSHYLFSLLLAAIFALLLCTRSRSRWIVLSSAAASVYIAALAYDGRHVFGQFQVLDSRFFNQHYSTLFPVLDAMPRARILTDEIASPFIAGSTKHDVLYSVYLQNLFITNEEIAERFCLTQTPMAPDKRHIAERDWLIHPSATRAAKQDPSVRQREVRMVEEACAHIDADPASSLRKYAVEFVLWDERRVPEWDLSRLKVPLEPVDKGEGWSLWKIPS